MGESHDKSCTSTTIQGCALQVDIAIGKDVKRIYRWHEEVNDLLFKFPFILLIRL